MPAPAEPPSGEDSLATRASLLGRLQNWEDADSWEEFARIYGRLILAVAIKAGLTEAEAKDVQQDTLLCVAKTVHEFESNPARGSFKHWLLNLTRWRIADHFRRRSPAAQSGSPGPVGDATPTRTSTLDRLPGPENLEAEWEIEWKRNLLATALDRVGRKVKPKHLQIFDLYSRRQWPAARVARELGVSVIQVYLVNHRLTKRLRREVAYLTSKLE